MFNKENIIFRLYEISIDDGNAVVNKVDIKIPQKALKNIKRFILDYFDKKRKTGKIYQTKKIPTKWQLVFSKPIKKIIDQGIEPNDDEYEYLTDDFCKNAISKQSIKIGNKKYLFVMFRPNDFFLILNLSIRNSITISDKNNLNISQIFFYPDTLLRYIYINKTGDIYNILAWEKHPTKSFINFIGIDNNFINFDYKGNIILIYKDDFDDGSFSKKEFEPNEFYNLILKGKLFIEKQNDLYYMSYNGVRKILEAVFINEGKVEISKLNILFINKYVLNTYLKEKLVELKTKTEIYDKALDLGLFEKYDINENDKFVKVDGTNIEKINLNSSFYNIIFGINMSYIGDNKYFNVNIEDNWLDDIIRHVFVYDDKILVISLFDDLSEDFTVSNVKNNLINFLNLSDKNNSLVNEFLMKIKSKIINTKDSIIIFGYKLLFFSYLKSLLKNTNNLNIYIDKLTNHLIKRFIESSTKKGVYSHENNFIEYKSGKIFNDLNSNFKEKLLEKVSDNMSHKIKSMDCGLIFYGIDEKNREIDFIDNKIYKKFNDDVLEFLEKKLEEKFSNYNFKLYKLPNNLNVLILYFCKK